VTFFTRLLIYSLFLGLPNLGHAMDPTLMPQELTVEILKLCCADMTQEERIVELVKLREVCTTWRALLTDTFIAETVGISGEVAALEKSLFNAIQHKCSATIELICKVYPDVIRALKEVPLFVIRCDNGHVRYDSYFIRTIKILHAYGLNPEVKVREEEADGNTRERYSNKLITAVIQFSTKEGRECFDLLLAHTPESDKTDLFYVAITGNINLHAMAQLIEHCPAEHVEATCEKIAGHEGVCCQKHLRPIVEALIRRGAQTKWRGYIQCHPKKCWDDTDYDVVVPVAKKYSLSLVPTLLWSKGRYLVGALVGFAIVYKYWWAWTDDDDDDDEAVELESEAQTEITDAQ